MNTTRNRNRKGGLQPDGSFLLIEDPPPYGKKKTARKKTEHVPVWARKGAK